MFSEIPSNASWVEIDAEVLRSNTIALSSYLGKGPALGAMLKANAYGHGIEQVVEVIHDLYSSFYTVLVEDALRIRATEKRLGKPKKRIIVVGSVAASDLPTLVSEDIECVIADLQWPDRLRQFEILGLGMPLKVHIFLDTGLGREGLFPETVAADLAFLSNIKNLIRVVGIMSHFSDAESPFDLGYAHEQLNRYIEGVKVLQESNIADPGVELHFAASSPAIVFPEARLTKVRFGISLYGYWTANESKLGAMVLADSTSKKYLKINPTLSWRCHSQIVKTLNAGDAVGYNRSYICQRKTRVAILPVGYFDGYPYSASHRAKVLVNGKKCSVLGSVMMNNIAVDVTDVTLSDTEGIVATLIGSDGREQITADDLAKMAGTINYNILTSIAHHVKRLVIHREENNV